jgi:hypothetical protein
MPRARLAAVSLKSPAASLKSRKNAWPVAIVADALAVIVFATIGRANHHEQIDLNGVWHTAWPFLLGAAAGLAIARFRGADPRTLRSGASVWLWTVVIGMVVRHSLGHGTPVAFVIVAAIVLAAFLLGWRVVLTWHRWNSRWRWLRS